MAAPCSAREGSPSITLSTPSRYVYTVNEMIHQADLEAGIALLQALDEARRSLHIIQEQLAERMGK